MDKKRIRNRQTTGTNYNIQKDITVQRKFASNTLIDKAVIRLVDAWKRLSLLKQVYMDMSDEYIPIEKKEEIKNLSIEIKLISGLLIS